MNNESTEQLVKLQREADTKNLQSVKEQHTPGTYNEFLKSFLYETANHLASQNRADDARIVHNIRNRINSGFKLSKKQNHILSMLETSLSKQLRGDKKGPSKTVTNAQDSTQTHVAVPVQDNDTSGSPQG